jgi:[ribosomal protein S5]-alanine N-acetyltransferase
MFAALADPAIYEFENAPPASEHWLREHYQRLEERGPNEGTEKWLNWVIRLNTNELVGYVQATVLQEGVSYIAYELNSRFWRQGLGSSAVQSMIDELKAEYGARDFVAVLKAANYRSQGLLLKLGFVPANPDETARYRDELDEIVMVMSPGSSTHAA